jgi:hypothetical protein
MRPLCEKDDAAKNLLDAIESFSEHLSLCRMSLLQRDLQKIRELLRVDGEARQAQTMDSLLYGLLNERFQQEFAPLMQDRYLAALAQWCVDHGLYQQALTLLCEEMPREVADSLQLQPKSEAIRKKIEDPNDTGKPFDWVYSLFHRFFAHLEYVEEYAPGQTGTKYSVDLRTGRDENGKWLYRTATLFEIGQYAADARRNMLLFDPNLEGFLKYTIRAYQTVIQCRNQINHASDVAGDPRLETKKLREQLQDAINRLRALPRKNSGPAA